MLFDSAVFLFLFLPIVFWTNLILPEKYSNYLLLMASLIFYAWGEPYYVVLLVFCILLNWIVGIGIGNSRGKWKNGILIAGIICNLSILVYYKYAGFLIALFNGVCNKTVLRVPEMVLPIGISFFTFQAISYIVDVYRDESKAQFRLVNVALYLSFFPQLIAGPIVKYKDIAGQIEERTVTLNKVTEGFKRFIYGLAKKVLLANVLGICVDKVYGCDIRVLDGKVAWIGALAYTLQIYYDFSGYSDMAIGLGKMFGFQFVENFNYPYLSKSISEFWRRWHISLGSWFREYVYVPMGGNRKGMKRTCLNLLFVFALTGLWHGADLSFMLWGIYHGVLVIFERIYLKKRLEKLPIVSWIYCFLAVNFGLVIFRAENVVAGVQYLSHMLLFWKYSNDGALLWNYINKKTIFIMVCGILGMGVIQKVTPLKTVEKWKNSVWEAIWCVLLLILCLASVANDTYRPFIYFQF